MDHPNLTYLYIYILFPETAIAHEVVSVGRFSRWGRSALLEEMEERHVAALSSAQQQQQHLVCNEENCLPLLSSPKHPKLDSIDLRDGWRWLIVTIVPQIFQWHLMCFHIRSLFGKDSRGGGELGFRDARLKIKWTSGHRAAGVELAQTMGLNRGPHWRLPKPYRPSFSNGYSVWAAAGPKV